MARASPLPQLALASCDRLRVGIAPLASAELRLATPSCARAERGEAGSVATPLSSYALQGRSPRLRDARLTRGLEGAKPTRRLRLGPVTPCSTTSALRKYM